MNVTALFIAEHVVFYRLVLAIVLIRLSARDKPPRRCTVG